MGAQRVLLILSGVLVLLWLAVGANWLLVLATPPARQAQETVDLSQYGLDAVSVRIVYPSLLSPEESGDDAGMLTVLASASRLDAVREFELRLVTGSDAIGFVDEAGVPVAGRIHVTPGYPDALPHSLRAQHNHTQLDGGLLTSRAVSIRPAIMLGGRVQDVPELAFSITLPSKASRGLRTILAAVQAALLPYLIGSTVLILGCWVALASIDRWRVREEHALAESYLRLQNYVRSERWPDARRALEEIRCLEPGYRDVRLIDQRVSQEEYVLGRRESLLREGLTAYRERNWPRAVERLSVLRDMSPYYRDVQFLQRTASLYADLQSRDRSRRTAAVEGLGQVGDLVDWEPLIEALGDPSEAVREATVRTLSGCGPEAFDALLGALNHDSTTVRENAYRVLESYGQSAREHLVAGLRSSDPTITRAVARLLGHVGARKELAESLLWLEDEHVPGVVSALVGVGPAAALPLIEVLVGASAERQPRVIDAIVALKHKVDITRHLNEACRGAKDEATRDLLNRVMATDAVCQELEISSSASEERRTSRRRPEPADGEENLGYGGVRGRNPLSRLFDRRES